MKQPIQGRVYYESDNGCNWFVLVPILCIALLVAFIMAFVLNIALALGWYLIFLAPIIAMLPVLGLLIWMNRAGKNRNRMLGGAAGLICGLILYLGYYWIGMVITAEEGEDASLRALPAYINTRAHTDRTEEVGHSRPSDQQRPGDVYMNYFTFAAEFLVVTIGLTMIGFGSAGMGWCPQCRKWKRQTVLRLNAGSGPTVIEALTMGKLNEALAAPTVFDKSAPHTALAIDYCHEDDQQGWPPCPFYFSIKDIGQNMAGSSRMKQFDGAMGKTLMSRMQMTHDEVLATAAKFSGLEFIPKPTNFSASFTPEPVQRAEYAEPTVDAKITSALEPGDKPIFTLTNKLVSNFLCLVPLLIFVAGFVSLFAGLAIYSNAAGKWALAQKIAGGVMIVVGPITGLYFFIRSAISAPWLGNAYLKRKLIRKINGRTDPVVRPDDPDSIFIEIVPPENINKTMLETAIDIGFLKIDSGRNELLIEGDVERYRIPSASIVSSEMQVIHKQAGQASLIFYFVILELRRDGQTWKTLLTTREGNGSIGHKKRAEKIAAINTRIQEIMASARKPVEAEFKY